MANTSVTPSKAECHNPAFGAQLLAMLGAKTSCKNRWRQVLAKANRIESKHILTLLPGIADAEMQAENLQLVAPSNIFDSC